MSAAFLVDATGITARVARSCGATRLRCDRLVAVFAAFEKLAARRRRAPTHPGYAPENRWPDAPFWRRRYCGSLG
jgi:hypothetical protein